MECCSGVISGTPSAEHDYHCPGKSGVHQTAKQPFIRYSIDERVILKQSCRLSRLRLQVSGFSDQMMKQDEGIFVSTTCGLKIAKDV